MYSIYLISCYVSSNNPNSFVVNRLVAFISDVNGTLYDSREENLSAVTSYLQNLISNVNYLVNDYGQNLVLFDALYTLNYQIIQFSGLFQFYVKNKYLAISPSDLIKIATWLNDEWSKYLLTANGAATGGSAKPPLTILLNNQLYFDNGLANIHNFHIIFNHNLILIDYRNLAIGINYMVMGVHPQCVNLAEVQADLRVSFINNLIPLLCSCGYEYYAANQPTTYFYTVDFIGEIDRSENYHVNLIRNGLNNAWANQYQGIND